MTLTTTDGFVRRTPTRSASERHIPQLIRSTSSHRPAQAVTARKSVATPQSSGPAHAQSLPVRPIRPYAVAPAPGPVRSPRRKRGLRLPTAIQLPLIVIAAMAAGILAQSEIIGQLFVVIYGIVAFIWKIPSRTTFTIALLSLIATTLLLIVRSNVPLAQSFATYTFLLLIAGVITLGRELKKEGGRVYNNRKILSNN